jgi:hypothetical protein
LLQLRQHLHDAHEQLPRFAACWFARQASNAEQIDDGRALGV